MAHPYQQHREHHVERQRVHHITGEYEGHRDYAAVYHRARGGGIGHADEAEDKAMVKHMVKSSALKAHGGYAKHRSDKPHRAKGGRVKHKGKTVVNVNVAPQQAAPHPMPLPVPGGPPGAGAAPPMPPRPPMAPPPGGPPGMPPGMPPRAMGGRAYKTGGAVEPVFGWKKGMGPTGSGTPKGKPVKLGKNAIYAPAKGAMGPTSGTGTGGAVARMEMSHRAAKYYKKTPPAVHTP